MNIRSLVLLLLFSIPVFVTAQVIVYETLQDYQEDKGTSYDNCFGWSKIFGKYQIRLKKDGKMVNVHCKKIWGFTYKDQLFRSTGESGKFGMLISERGVCYYENGVAHLDLLRFNKENINFPKDHFAYFSDNLGTELFPYDSGNIKYLKEVLPKHHDLFDCIKRESRGKFFNATKEYVGVQGCVKNYY